MIGYNMRNSQLIPQLFVILAGLLATVTLVGKSDDSSATYSQEALDYLAISNPETLSAASKRALERNYHLYENWYGRFSVEDLAGDFAFEEGVIRRDPSRVLLIDGEYYTWYTKSVGRAVWFDSGDPEAKVFPWDKSEVWYATSPDGFNWTERGPAVVPGETGRYDDRSVFTPEIMAHEGKFYLVYQAVKAPYVIRVKNTVGLAVADSPHGPWRVLDEPILEPAENGEWRGEKDDRFAIKTAGDFDSHKVHDPTLLFYRDKFYLYYKGERMGERKTSGGREIRWGVALADHPEGPYQKSPYNPITQSGHELCVWPYQGGIALIHSHDGPEKRTIQWSPDGINFEIRAYLEDDVPGAMGLVESLDRESHPLSALQWGLAHKYVVEPGLQWWQGYNAITRFEMKPAHP